MLLEAIRNDFPAPTVHARNLHHTSAAMWDAFWAYQPDGWLRRRALFHRESPLENVALAPDQRAAAQAEAISYAAFRILSERYRKSDGAEEAMADFRWLMQQLGYDPEFDSTIGASPAAVGNRIAGRLRRQRRRSYPVFLLSRSQRPNPNRHLSRRSLRQQPRPE